MSLKGNIKDFGLLDVLQLISQNQKSGILHIFIDNNKFAEIYFTQGKLIDIKLTTEEDNFKIGNYLVSKNIITEERLNEILNIQKKKPIRLGKLLVEENIVSEKEFKDIYKNLNINKLEKILSLENGTYEFISANIDFNIKEIEPISIDSVILDALKNIDEIKLFKKKLSNFDIVYQKNQELLDNILLSNKELEEPVVKIKDKFYLNQEAFAIFNMINGSNNLNEILKKSGFNEHSILKVVYLFLNYGLIKPVNNIQKEKKTFNNLFVYYVLIIIIFILTMSLLTLNLTSLDVVKNYIISNEKIQSEVKNRNRSYHDLINSIKTIEKDDPILYHNPKKLY
ncbi:DUF4388 domain-containing protein [Deferribacter thermophilus]|uniref:DUF4388 domain-containing protein n=1 Tax=Deferribacter thermophilus TaxID=53573 RepID=UPI003C229BA3